MNIPTPFTRPSEYVSPAYIADANQLSFCTRPGTRPSILDRWRWARPRGPHCTLLKGRVQSYKCYRYAPRTFLFNDAMGVYLWIDLAKSPHAHFFAQLSPVFDEEELV